MDNERNASPPRRLPRVSGSSADDNGQEVVIELRESENDSFLGPPNNRSIQGVNQEPLPGADKQPPPSTRLHRSSYVFLLVTLYAGFALFAWVVTCILTHRPITTQHYGEWLWDTGSNDLVYVKNSHALFVKNEQWYRTARVIQSIVSVLTIPLTSAVCSSAAVIFVQHNQKSFRLSIRQVMVLADKGWSDPAAYVRTITSWKRYGSSFIVMAILLNILGGIISPLQEVFLASKTIKTPTYPLTLTNLLDIPDQWAIETGSNGSHDINLIVAQTRNTLLIASKNDLQSQLWQGTGYNCSVSDTPNEETNQTSTGGIPLSCYNVNKSFDNMTALVDPFLAELPQGYSTGLVRQFIPRINSTTVYEAIPAAEYPVGCDSLPGAFFAGYSDLDRVDGWGLQACMPANLINSPWKSTRDRQDFSEVLYLNVTLYLNDSNMFRITVNTTAGYFELPNYMNGGLPGPLLAKDPNSLCGRDCITQGWVNISSGDISNNDAPSKARRQLVSNLPEGSLALDGVYNKGPLLTTAIALFGSGSFFANRIAHPQAYYSSNITTNSDGQESGPINDGSCIDFAPMGWMLNAEVGGFAPCISNGAGGPSGVGLRDYMRDWVKLFVIDTTAIIDNSALLTNAFNVAAFIANQAWLTHNVNGDGRSLTVSYDVGADMEVPTISQTGLILVSALLALYLLALFALASYACLSPRWTSQLDSFTMMRLGAAMADKLHLMVGRRTDQVKALDEMPGWIGDIAEAGEEVGRLGLGAPHMVSGERRYRCYDGDEEPFSKEEKRASKARYDRLR